HHLLKTFWCGPGGWHDEQYPDGTVLWTSPSGHTYRTVPGSALLVPALCVPTATLNVARRQPLSPRRGVMMPTRRRSRASDRHRWILAERSHNRENSAKST
ncbi:MAG TPA: HNH endonuclease, partial [Mycobacterium sp.]|nr:HNH endonuclease [Mycobacterium sp.]